MDIIESRSRNVMQLALDGLYERQKAIASNTANVMTPDYQRKDVTFENQLRNVIEEEDLKASIKAENSLMFKKNPADALEALKAQDPAQIAFMQKNSFKNFAPEVQEDFSQGDESGNNVVLEEEMMHSARTGTQYAMLSRLMATSFQGLEKVIKGQ